MKKGKVSSETKTIVAENERLQAHVTSISEDTYSVSVENNFHSLSSRTEVIEIVVQALISVQALVFDLAQLTCQKRFDCRNEILGSSAILLGTSYS